MNEELRSTTQKTVDNTNQSLAPHAAAPSARPPATSPAASLDPRSSHFYGGLLAAAAVLVAGAAISQSAFGATRAHMAAATASPRTDHGMDERWGAGTVTVVLDGSLDDMDPAAKDAVTAAFGAWMNSSTNVNPVVVNRSTDRIGAAQDGVNRISFGVIDIPGHEKDVAATISYADDATGEIIEADTIFNNAYAFQVMPGQASDSRECIGGKYDVQDVATHEFGHFYGLGEDLSDQTTTMFITSKPCQTHKRMLSESDVTSMNGLYAVASPSSQTSSTGSSASCAISRRGSHDFSGLIFFGVAIFGLMIRRGTCTRICREP
ncbi:MAG: matrixin family metalloprotease [Polyangiaceae bacterium]